MIPTGRRWSRMGSMTAEERRPELRAAIYRRDHKAIIALLRTRPWPGTALQLIGDGLIATLSQQQIDSAAVDLARDCIEELQPGTFIENVD